MKKLDNKGFTVIELILSFVFVTIISLGMFSVLMNYKNKSNEANIKNEILTYKNSLTATIQKDITSKILRRMGYCKNGENELKNCVMLYFNDSTSARLSVENGEYTDEYGDKYNSNYISYNGIRYDTKDPAYTSVSSKDILDIRKDNNFTVRGMTIYKIYIPITHDDIDEEFAIKIVANGYDYTYGAPALPIPPTISVVDSNGKIYPNGSDILSFNGMNLDMKLQGGDFKYGEVKGTQYCLYHNVDGGVNGCTWKAYTGPVSLPDLGSYYIYSRTTGVYNNDLLYGVTKTKYQVNVS